MNDPSRPPLSDPTPPPAGGFLNEVRQDSPPPHPALRRFRRALPIPARLVLGLLFLVALCTGILLIPGMGTRPLHPMEALFTATSALSVTGLSIIVPAQDLALPGQIFLLAMIEMGGVGFMVIAVMVLRLLGRRVPLLHRLALRDSLGLVSPRAILQLTEQVVLTTFIIQGIGALLLWLNWRDLLGDRAPFYALFHAVSAFCNAGFDLFAGLPGHAGIPTDPVSLKVMRALILLGGLGIPVLANLITWPRNRQLSLHTKLTLMLVASLIVAGTFGIYLAESQPGSALASETWRRRLEISIFQSISARTAGFSALTNFADLSPASQLMIMAQMFIGCAPASMGGGTTTGTFIVLTLALWGYASGKPEIQIGGRSISAEMVRKGSAVLTISLALVLVATWLICITHPVTIDRAAFEVVSAFATCGLTLNFTGELNTFGQLVIIPVMFWGRLGALTIFAALAQQPAPTRVHYPEEQILIG